MGGESSFRFSQRGRRIEYDLDRHPAGRGRADGHCVRQWAGVHQPGGQPGSRRRLRRRLARANHQPRNLRRRPARSGRNPRRKACRSRGARVRQWNHDDTPCPVFPAPNAALVRPAAGSRLPTGNSRTTTPPRAVDRAARTGYGHVARRCWRRLERPDLFRQWRDDARSRLVLDRCRG